MSDTEDSTDEVREAGIGVLTALLYSLAIIKGDDKQEQLSDFLEIILKSLYSLFILIENITFHFYFFRF